MNRDDHTTLTLQDEAGAPVLVHSGGVTLRPPARPVKARVYRLRGPGPASWAWRCDPCGVIGFGCPHKGLHPDLSWTSAMCDAFRHVHISHPRPVREGATEHQVLLDRRRCSPTQPSTAQVRMARRVLGSVSALGAGGPPVSGQLQDFAAEILSLDTWAPR